MNIQEAKAEAYDLAEKRDNHMKEAKQINTRIEQIRKKIVEIKAKKTIPAKQ